MSKKKEMKEITDYIDKYRKRNSIIPTHGHKPEPSCIAQGEGYNLLYCQLINTVDSEWKDDLYRDNEIRKLVLKEVRYAKADEKTCA